MSKLSNAIMNIKGKIKMAENLTQNHKKWLIKLKKMNKQKLYMRMQMG